VIVEGATLECFENIVPDHVPVTSGGFASGLFGVCAEPSAPVITICRRTRTQLLLLLFIAMLLVKSVLYLIVSV